LPFCWQLSVVNQHDNLLFLFQKDKDSELSFRWRHCNITQEPLEAPIAACGLGKLYKKQAVIEALLDHTILPESASHIKSIKVCILNLAFISANYS
jgi:hypothetical protein